LLLIVFVFLAYYSSGRVRSWFLANEFRRDFAATILATLLGIILGVPAALEVERGKSDTDRMEQEQQLLAAVDRTLEQNEVILKKLNEQLSVDRVINYNVDPFFLEATSESRYRVLNNIRVNQQIESVRTELVNLYHMIRTQFDLAYGIESRTTNFIEQRRQLLDGLNKRAVKVQAMIADVRSKVKEEIKR
jgi:hypothetical protein